MIDQDSHRSCVNWESSKITCNPMTALEKISLPKKMKAAWKYKHKTEKIQQSGQRMLAPGKKLKRGKEASRYQEVPFIVDLSVCATGVMFRKQSQLVYIVDYIDRFSNVEPTLHLGDEAYLIMVEDFSDMFLDLVCQYSIEYFCINVHEGYWSIVLFLSCVFV
ncbi:hypothetical protein H671_2g7212 [Cricetulus griseus]|nr:hypothetical protein H671_2g7212 [Cricetulus griseus]